VGEKHLSQSFKKYAWYAPHLGLVFNSQRALERLHNLLKGANRGNQMSKFLLAVAVCAFCLPLSFASAAEEEEAMKAFGTEGLRKYDLTRYVPSGKSRTLWFLAGVNRDCSVQDELEVKTTKAPEHGTVEIVPGENFPAYKKESALFKCNEKKIRGFNVNYKSAQKYVGPDEFELLVLYPNGYAQEVRYTMVVR
jgi:hypothetical protein